MTERTDRRGRRRPLQRLEQRLARVGDEWTVVAVGASRWYRLKAETRHPGYRFMHERDAYDEWWTVKARKAEA